jgi:hypothetical protein
MQRQAVGSVKWRSGLLEVCAKPARTYEIVAPVDHAREQPEVFLRLLGLLLIQAHRDGMQAIDLSARPDGDGVTLRYEGRTADGEGGVWDMSPPPAEAYAGLVRAIVSTCTFDAGVRPRGVIHAKLNGAPVDVRVELDGWYHVRLTFDARVT